MVRLGRLREHRDCQSDSRDKGKLQWVVCVRAPWEEVQIGRQPARIVVVTSNLFLSMPQIMHST